MMSSLLKMQGWEQVAKEAEFNPSRMASLCSISERQLQRIAGCVLRHRHRDIAPLKKAVAKEEVPDEETAEVAEEEAEE